jgi:hypothetical protein
VISKIKIAENDQYLTKIGELIKKGLCPKEVTKLSRSLRNMYDLASEIENSMPFSNLCAETMVVAEGNDKKSIFFPRLTLFKLTPAEIYARYHAKDNFSIEIGKMALNESHPRVFVIPDALKSFEVNNTEAKAKLANPDSIPFHLLEWNENGEWKPGIVKQDIANFGTPGGKKCNIFALIGYKTEDLAVESLKSSGL